VSGDRRIAIDCLAIDEQMTAQIAADRDVVVGIAACNE
jgi:hypothetical protein